MSENWGGPETNQTDDSNKGDGWERQAIETLAFSALSEQRKSRRWNVFFRTLFFGYFVLLLFLYFPSSTENDKSEGRGPHVAVVDITGVISSDSQANANDVIKGLKSAFEDEETAAVVLRINSPGGSPVQSGQINDAIYRLKDKYPDIKVYTVVEEVCASGGYYIAAASDAIYADKASIVGSIGVRMGGFGFVGLMEKFGIERRLITAGANKGILDPFSPVDEASKRHAQKLLNTIHQQFIDVVTKGRKDKLVKDDKIFSGLFWTGEQGLELGLIDGLADLHQVAEKVIGVKKVVNFTVRPTYLERLAERFGATMASVVVKSMRENVATLD